MCVDEPPRHNPHRRRHDVGPVEVVGLEPVEHGHGDHGDGQLAGSVHARPGAGPPGGPDRMRPARPCSVMTDREVPDALIAEHGLSMLVTIAKAGREHRVLFDTGASPNGVVENMRRLDIDPSSIEAIVCSHGHFDHTAGLDGLLRVLGPVGMPVLIHPHFWRRRRVVLPGRDPVELPTTSATALREARLRHYREPATKLSARPIGPDHRRGAPRQRLRAGLPDPAGLDR